MTHPVLAIAAHKKVDVPQDPLYLPIQAGAAGKESIGFVRDDSNQNISQLNPMLSELTVLYWIWKNLPADKDAFGLVHYRRYFKGSAPLEGSKVKVLSEQEAKDLLSRCDVIVPKRRSYYIETLESHYSHTHNPKDLDLLRDVVKDLAPEYLDTLNAHLQKRSGHMFNIFLMSREKGDAFCSFLFPIAIEICKRADLDDTEPFLRRMPGRLAEFLLDIWIEKNGISVLKVPVVDTQPVNWFKKGSAFLKAKFFSRKYDASF